MFFLNLHGFGEAKEPKVMTNHSGKFTVFFFFLQELFEIFHTNGNETLNNFCTDIIIRSFGIPSSFSGNCLFKRYEFLIIEMMFG